MAASTSNPIVDKVAKNIQPLTFPELEADGSNYLRWCVDFKSYFVANELEGILNYPVPAHFNAAQRSRAIIFMRKHIDDVLQQQYLQIEDPADLWRQLEARFRHEKTIFLPKARNDWANLRVYDFADYTSYNNALFKILSQLRLCGETKTEEEIIDKTLSTFPTAAALLAQMYRSMKFKTYSELTQFLLLSEQQQQLLLKNNEAKPPREANTAEIPSRRPKGGWKSDQQKQNKFAPYTKPNNKSSNHSSSSGSRSSNTSNACQKCGRIGHKPHECRAGAYTEKLYKELQELQKGQRESHSLDVPSLDGTDPENYTVIVESLSTHISSEMDGDMALLDSGSTHTILRDPRYFDFSRQESETWRHGPTASRRDSEAWRTCELSTVAGKRKMTFREGRAKVKLPGGATLIYSHAMFAPEAQRSLISFRDLRAHGIHALTAIRDGEEILNLMQGDKCLATARCGANGLYEIPISCLSEGQTLAQEDGSPRSDHVQKNDTCFNRSRGLSERCQQDWSVRGVCSRKTHPEALTLETAASAPSTTP
ncbi:hypothetical protein KC19_2G183600 [Ceratodon purpureus]|uniref:CCHC-type domain-containing protein n=1 Tax=Ceratodon purpureus TaxID=3225 RepID=A0A8T0IWV0_CERPU|nr:hypothetical protein KC19_2G183600 [Ceratodon purpureus]